MKKKISITINENTLKDIDSLVDNVIIRNRSHAIEHLVKMALGENKVAVILSGGDEKMLKIGSSEYRPTARIGSSTVVEIAVKKLRDNGFKTIYVVARQNVLTKIFEILKDGSEYGVKIDYVEEKGAKGTAESLSLLKGKINTNFIVVYGDVVFKDINLDELWKSHTNVNAVVTLVLTTSPKPSQKGTVEVEGNRILKFTQKPAESDTYLVFSPIFAAEPSLLDYDGRSLEKNVFPLLAEKGLMQGHLSSKKEVHIHRKEDVKKVR